jgi:hypothetical protein
MASLQICIFRLAGYECGEGRSVAGRAYAHETLLPKYWSIG